jgi:hypothetical protein
VTSYCAKAVALKCLPQYGTDSFSLLTCWPMQDQQQSESRFAMLPAVYGVAFPSPDLVCQGGRVNWSDGRCDLRGCYSGLEMFALRSTPLPISASPLQFDPINSAVTASLDTGASAILSAPQGGVGGLAFTPLAINVTVTSVTAIGDWPATYSLAGELVFRGFDGNASLAAQLTLPYRTDEPLNVTLPAAFAGIVALQITLPGAPLLDWRHGAPYQRQGEQPTIGTGSDNSAAEAVDMGPSSGIGATLTGPRYAPLETGVAIPPALYPPATSYPDNAAGTYPPTGTGGASVGGPVSLYPPSTYGGSSPPHSTQYPPSTYGGSSPPHSTQYPPSTYGPFLPPEPGSHSPGAVGSGPVVPSMVLAINRLTISRCPLASR